MSSSARTGGTIEGETRRSQSDVGLEPRSQSDSDDYESGLFRTGGDLSVRAFRILKLFST